jgi:hypothetical protein
MKGIWLVIGVVLVALFSGAAYWLAGPRTAQDNHAGVLLGPAPASEVTGPAWFRDMTAGSGLDFTFRNGEEANQYTILEVMGGGVALLDYDGDGLLDIFVTGGGYFDGPDRTQIKGHPCKLYRNLGNWQFQDVTKEVGLDRPWWYTQGVAVADYDRDGWPDLLVTGYGRLALFHNEPDGKGGRRFVDVTRKMGLHDESWSTSAGWADLDGDGFPDLYVCHYLDWSFANNPHCKGQRPDVPRDVCPVRQFKPLVHALFHNDRGKGFRNVSAEHGFRADGYGLGVVLVDLNGDGRPDVYVANDASNNFLFFNRGGKLEEKGLLAGAAVDDNGHYNAGMGVDAGDWDGSGRPSLWVTNYQGELHALYASLGRELFQHRSRSLGLGALGQHFVGFGTGFVDVDNDGWEDLVIVNGHVLRYPAGGSPVQQRPVLLHNVEHQGGRFFKDISRQGGAFFQMPALGRGVAIGDLDNDGWPDLVISHINSPVTLLRNEAFSASKANWLGIRLVGREHRDVVGSTVVVATDNRQLTRFVKGGGSYLSARDPRLLFGLGSSEQVRSVTVRWSWGPTQTWDNLEPNRYWDLHEGEAAARPK